MIDARLYPLAASYWNYLHEGGDAWFGVDTPLADVTFSLHPVADFEADGAVGDAIATWSAEAAGSQRVFEDLPPGGYWIVASLPRVADGPARAEVCVGLRDPVELACGGFAGTTGSDTTGGEESSGESSDSGPTVPLDDSSGGDELGSTGSGEAPRQDDEPSSGGCACSASPAGPDGSRWSLLVLTTVVLGARRRRRCR